MPSMLSSRIWTRKQLDICGRGVAALKSVGVACVNHFSDRRLYVSITLSTSSM